MRYLRQLHVFCRGTLLNYRRRFNVRHATGTSARLTRRATASQMVNNAFTARSNCVAGLTAHHVSRTIHDNDLLIQLLPSLSQALVIANRCVRSSQSTGACARAS